MKISTGLIRIILLWLIVIIGMMLHFNYHVSKIFYGINVVRPSSEGVIPLMAHILKNVYYHLPILFILLHLYFNTKLFKWVMLITSFIYTVSHILHLVDEFSKPKLDISQVILLSIVLGVSVLLNKEYISSIKNEKL